MKIPTITNNNLLPRTEKEISGEKSVQQADPKLQSGQLLKAKVLKGSSPNGQVLLEVSGKTISAKSLVKLASGDHIWLEVNKEGSTPNLSLVPQKGAIHNFLQLLFSTPQGGGNLLERMLPLVGMISPANEDSPLPPLVRVLLSLASPAQGGTADLNQVKLMALLFGGHDPNAKDFQEEILQQLRQLSTWEKFPPQSKKLLSEGMEFIDKFQKINMSPSGPDNASIFLFPCFFREEAGGGEWMFSRNEKDNHSASSFELNFFLDMSKLGPLYLTIFSDDKNLNGNFQVSSRKVINFIKNRSPDLEKKLLTLGYHSVSFQYNLSRMDILMELKKSLMNKGGLNSFSLVDVRA